MVEGYEPSGLTPEEFAALPPYDEIAGKTFSEVRAIYGEEVAIRVIIASDPDCWVPTEAEFARARPAIEVDPHLVNAYLTSKSRGPAKIGEGTAPIAVLGIDAAWTKGNPSGVALIRQLQGGSWECVAVAPSYKAFLDLAEGNNVNWEATPVGGLPEPGRLLEAAAFLLKGAEVTVVAVDIPVSNRPIDGRRPCDIAISRAFGGALCGTHSPNVNRPGALSKNLIASLKKHNYNLRTEMPTVANDEPPAKATIEVYPHPAIVRLLNLDHRLKYKVEKSNDFWRGRTLLERRKRLRSNFQKLRIGLAAEIHGIPEDVVPTAAYVRSRRSLKRYEDSLDALVCAWVGSCYLDNRAESFGDEDAAIWVPVEGQRAQNINRRRHHTVMA